ncbi:alpha/beta hydrolase [Nocardioides campestrisoli]|uniref:alpha/beta hydrolase n=1 Tax=Nocardioides campestrisoli TaxID=2736757 RepID=UPI0015E65D23|nr:alpha/beta hydrolase [Nocardioides campestrisoli]
MRSVAPGPAVDILGAPYEVEDIDLGEDDEGPVVATLVRRPTHGETNCAVLHLHGFADYFFQTEYAEWWTARGYTFYALDLRKYGRSIRGHQTPNYVSDLAEYFPEIDEAFRRITERDGHEAVVGSAHSTGGLTLPLWAHDRQPGLAGMVLNSPWFDLQGPWWLRTVGTELVRRLADLAPRTVVPRTVSGLYARSLHLDHEGDWSFDLAWKPLESWPVRTGWLRAVRAGHARLHRGLEVGCPALVLSSARTGQPVAMDEDVHTTDIVLDVEQIRRWAPSLGAHVTSVAIPGARHDVVLSRPQARAEVYRALDAWLTAWVEAPEIQATEDQPTRNAVSATSPTTTIVARSHGSGSLRPTLAPS